MDTNPPATSNTRAAPSSPAKALFAGEILAHTLFPYPALSANEKELLGLINASIERFLGEHDPRYRDYDRAAEQPESLLQGLREMGLFGLIIPEAYGGIGLSNAAYARVLAQCSRHDSATTLTVAAHSSIGLKGLLLFGTEAQKQRYLPRLASGELIAAFCLTEAGAGSDAAAIRTRAQHDADGSWRLNGEKIWITNGGIAGLFTVFARTGEDGAMTAFIVERDWPGVSTGAHEDKLGIRASSTTTVHFDAVRIPPENVLGEPGQGFKVAMSILNNGRTGLGGAAVGAMKTCIRLAAAQAAERRQFDRPIAEFGLIQEKIATMSVDCYATESVIWMVAGMIDSGAEDYSVEAAIGKIFASEAMWRVANEALQIAGGNGYMKDFAYERYVRDARILTIFEGTSEILRLYVALSGMRSAGNLLGELKESLQSIFDQPIQHIGVLSEYAGRRLAFATHRGRERIVGRVPSELANEALIFEKYALELGRDVDILLRRHGKTIVEKQFAMKRVAEVAVDLFVGLCVLSRTSALPAEAPQREQALRIARLFSQQAKRRMNQNLRRLLRNEDEDMKQLADYIGAEQGMVWDVIDTDDSG